jgi:hypothetical protein
MLRGALFTAFVLLAPALAAAQDGPPPPPPGSDVPLSPPPLIQAVPENPDGPPPPPPLPSGVEAPKARQPGQPQTGFPYSPAVPEKPPGPEVGLMISESLFGMLTSAGVTLLPYFLLIRPLEVAAYNGGSGSLGIDPAVGTIIFILLFAAVPLATSQTVVSLANGSRYYQVDSWPAALVGLGVEAIAVALYYLIRATAIGPMANPQNGVTANEWLLLINTIVTVPVAQMLITNVIKKPKTPATPPVGAALNYTPRHGLFVALPIPAPVTGTVNGQERSGLLFPVFSGVL